MTNARPRILLADDNDVNRLVATKMLEKLGYEVVGVADGVEAVEAAMSGSFSAVLLDCRMPLLDGYDAARMIRDVERRDGRVPIRIIALTASDLKKDRDEAMRAGMDEFLVKPLGLDVLAEALSARDRHSAPPPRPPPHERLGELAAVIGEDRIRQIYRVFLWDSKRVLVRLQGAIAKNDARLFRDLAHGLKGSCANVGEEELGDLAWQMENLGREGDLGEAGPLVAKFRKGLSEAEEVATV